MKNNTLIFARIVAYLVGFVAFAVLTILLPELAREEAAGKLNPPVTWPFFVLAYILATPFFIAIYQTLQLLKLIDKNKAFSHDSIKALQNIKTCAISFSILIFLITVFGVSFLRAINPTEDAPPFFMMGSILTFISIIVTVFVALLKKILTDAVHMKSENDLIV